MTVTSGTTQESYTKKKKWSPKAWLRHLMTWENMTENQDNDLHTCRKTYRLPEDRLPWKDKNFLHILDSAIL